MSETRSRHTQQPRIVGIDAARGIALIGMLIAHAAPNSGLWRYADLAASERSRILFAVTAGMSLAVFAMARSASAGRAETRRQVGVRAVSLLLIGLGIAALGPPIHVIIDEYGVAFAILVPLLFLSPRTKLILGVLGTVIMPFTTKYVELTLVASAATTIGSASAGTHRNALFDAFVGWFVTGSYPVGIWGSVMLVGMASVELIVPLLRRAWYLLLPACLVAGAALVLVAYRIGLAGSQDVLDAPQRTIAGFAETLHVVGNVLLCFFVAFTLILLVDQAAGRIRTTVGAVVLPLRRIGAMPLTTYTVQAIGLWYVTRVAPGSVDDAVFIIGMVILNVVFAIAWFRWVNRRGPLELVIAALSTPRR